MSHEPCPVPHSMRITFERRRSDFERDARVTPFTGSCCSCCCCLHWIGAAVGGVVGMRAGWAAAEKSLNAPLPAEGRAGLHLGLGIGIVTAIAFVVGSVIFALGSGALATMSQVYLVALAFAPPVFLLPLCAPLVISAYRARGKALSVYRADIARLPAKEGASQSLSLYRAKLTPAPKTQTSIVQFSVFCRHCWFDLGESMHLAACPSCGAETGHPVISGPDYGVSIAWRSSLVGLGAATLGGAGGYLVMVALAAIFGH